MKQSWDYRTHSFDHDISEEAKEAVFGALKSFTNAVCHEIKEKGVSNLNFIDCNNGLFFETRKNKIFQSYELRD